MSLDEVVKIYDTLVRPSSGQHTRKKISVQLVSQQMKEAAPFQMNVLVLDDGGLIPYKSGLGCYPAPLPVDVAPGRADLIEMRANL